MLPSSFPSLPSSHTSTHALSDGKLHPLLWSPSLSTFQCVETNSDLFHCICLQFVTSWHLSPLSPVIRTDLSVFLLCRWKWSHESKRGRKREFQYLFIFPCSYMASQSTWADGKQRENRRVFFLHLSAMSVCKFVLLMYGVSLLCYLWQASRLAGLVGDLQASLSSHITSFLVQMNLVYLLPPLLMLSHMPSHTYAYFRSLSLHRERSINLHIHHITNLLYWITHREWGQCSLFYC